MQIVKVTPKPRKPDFDAFVAAMWLMFLRAHANP
jgi:hypothetical protein